MMDSFEFSKIAGAGLFALLAIFGPRAAIDIWQGAPQKVVGGFTLPTAAPAPAETPAGSGAAPAAGGAAPAAGFDAAAVVAMVATAKPDAGQASFKKCLACHTASPTEGSKLGPNLWNIVGHARAARADFSGYSEAIKSKGGEWTYPDLASFLHSPKGFLPGTKMIFPGIADPADLADLLAYLRTLSDNPVPLPQ